MRTSSGTSSLPIAMATASSGASAPPKPDSDASFHDVLQQHGGDASKTPDKSSKTQPAAVTTTVQQTAKATATEASQLAEEADVPEAPSSADLPITPDVPIVPTHATATTSGITDTTSKSRFVPITTGTALSAMIVQAAAQISNARNSGALKGPALPAPTKTNSSGKDSSNHTTDPSQTVSIGLDLSTLIAQVSKLASTGPQVPVTKTTATATTSASDAGTATSTDGSAAQSVTSTTTGAQDLSTLMAQATNAAQTSAPSTTSPSSTMTTMMVGKELPSTTLNAGVTTSPTKEKKSTGVSGEGTFIQAGTVGSSSIADMLSGLSSNLTGAIQSPQEKQVATNSDSTDLSLNSMTGGATGIAGTANVEKGNDMNATLNFPEIFSGYGTGNVSQQTPVDMHIQLSTNNDFEDALKQVMHVAQLTQTNESRTPMRVAIEIQTPPGAIVNVYVSRQNDQWRAQLSTNDPQALSWVQDKMSSLRGSSDLGVEVRWLPPQMESAATTTSAGDQSNLGWDRGNQNQQSQQQQEDRQQSGRQKRAEVYAGIGAGQFMETLTAVGSAA